MLNKLFSKIIKSIKRQASPVNWYNLRNVTPTSSSFGFDRGTPIDRYYIEKFINTEKATIKGVVLEIAESTYSKKFDSGVSSFEILHFTSENKNATIVADLTDLDQLPENKIDCFICTQTLNFIFDFQKAIKGIHQILKPGGITLVTVAGLTQISKYDMDRWGDFWRFNTLSALKSFESTFGSNQVEVDYFGNVLSATALLQGISMEELSENELNFKDPNYQVLITIKATKAI